VPFIYGGLENGLKITLFKRSNVSGEDVEVSQCQLQLEGVKVLGSIQNLRNKRGRGERGTISVSYEFIPAISSDWFNSLPPLWTLRLYLVDFRGPETTLQLSLGQTKVETGIKENEKVILELASLKSDDKEFSVRLLGGEVLENVNLKMLDGKTWLHFGNKTCAKILGVSQDASTPFPSSQDVLSIKLDSIQGVNSNSCYVVAQIFPLNQGDQRGHAKFRDFSRSATRGKDADGAIQLNESMQFPWTGTSRPADCRTNPVVHVSLWDETSNQMIAESSLSLQTALQTKTFNLQQITDPKPAILTMETGFSPQGYSSARGQSYPISISVFRATNIPSSTQGLKISIEGYYGSNQSIVLRTKEAFFPDKGSNELVFNESLEFGSVLQSEGNGNIKISIVSSHDIQVAHGEINLTKVHELLESGPRDWISLNLEKPFCSVAGKKPQLLLQLNYLRTTGMNSSRSSDGFQTSILSQAMCLPSSLQSTTPVPGKINLEVLEMKCISHIYNDCTTGWIKVSCGEWSSSTTHISISKASVAQGFTWNFNSKFPLQWSLSEKSIPILDMVFKSQLSSGAFLEQTLESLDLAPFVFSANQTMESWLPVVDVSTNETTALVKVRVAFRINSTSTTKISHNVLNGKIHVHLRGATKLNKMLGSFAELECGLTKVRSAVDEDGGSNPVWNEHFLIPIVDTKETPLLHVSIKDGIKTCGKVSIPVFDYILVHGHVFDASLPLRDVVTGVKVGLVSVSVQALLSQVSNEKTENFKTITIVGGKSLDYSPYNWSGQIEPKIQISQGNRVLHCTNPASWDTKSNPLWNQSFTLSDDEISTKLSVQLLNDCTIEHEQLVGQGILDPINDCDTWVELIGAKDRGLGKVRVVLDSCTNTVAALKDSVQGNRTIIRVSRGRQLKDVHGRVHKASLKLFAVHDNENVLIGESVLQNDGLKKSQRVLEENRMFEWNHEFCVLTQNLMLSVRDERDVQVESIILKDLSPSPTWFDLSLGGQLEISETPIPYIKGILKFTLTEMIGSFPSRYFASDEDGVREFVKLRLDPEGDSVKSSINELHQPLHIQYSNFDKIRNFIVVGLYCDDPDYPENILGQCEIDLSRMFETLKFQDTQVLKHAITGRDMNVSMSFQVELTSMTEEPAIHPADKEMETMKCLTLQRLKGLFYKIDTDGSGEISVNEFVAALTKDKGLVRVLGLTGSNKSVFNAMDSDGNGIVSWDEFQKYCTTQLSKEEGNIEFENKGDESMAPVSKVKRIKKKKMTTKKRKSSILKTRDTTTHSKYDENEMELRRLNDPLELKDKVNELRFELSKMEQENKQLRAERNKKRKSYSKITDDSSLNTIASDNPFKVSPGGDESLAPQDDDSDVISLKKQLRQSVLERQILEANHKFEMQNMNDQTTNNKVSLDEINRKSQEFEEQKSALAEKLAVEKSRRLELSRKLEQSTLKLGLTQNNDQFWKLVKSRALEEEENERLMRAYEIRDVKNKHAIKLQAYFRKIRLQKDYLNEKQARKNGAMKIQSLYRSRTSQQQYQESRKRANGASALIQSSYRGQKTRSEISRLHKAAIQIQCQLRKKKGLLLVEETKRQHMSAVGLQCIFRRHRSLLQVSKKQSQQNTEKQAAVRLQAAIRGNNTRGEFKIKLENEKMKKHEHRAATSIQKHARRKQAKKEKEKQIQVEANREVAACRIQRIVKNRYSKVVSNKENNSQKSTASFTDVNDALQKSKSFVKMYIPKGMTAAKAHESLKERFRHMEKARCPTNSLAEKILGSLR